MSVTALILFVFGFFVALVLVLLLPLMRGWYDFSKGPTDLGRDERDFHDTSISPSIDERVAEERSKLIK